MAALLPLWHSPVGAVTVLDDFSDNNDTVNPAWFHLDGAVGSTGQTWDASGGRYHLVGPGSLDNPHPDLIGYGFVGAYTGPQYTDVRVSVDVVELEPFTQSFIAVAARMNGDNSLPSEPTGIALHGYSYQYEGGAGEMVLNILHGGGFKDVGSQPVDLDFAKDYRFVLEVVGNVLHGQVFELDDMGNQVAMIAEKFRDLDANPPDPMDLDGNPATPDEEFVPYASGYSGLYSVGHVAFSEANVTYDNFKSESIGAAAPGDFDGDGDVDGTDLSSWRTSFGADDQADADGDGDTDGADLLVWQQDFTGAQSVGAAAAVPEPATGLLLSLGALAALSVVRRGR
ncbi:MAG: PEP-CTERM sorting domain-containing protein [Pirellulales bacterium]|nr:PEP-CTERM sorting domain-containing protein [Pirellulales bacterium]